MIEILIPFFSIVAGVLLGKWMTEDLRKNVPDTDWEKMSRSWVLSRYGIRDGVTSLDETKNWIPSSNIQFELHVEEL